MKIEKNSKLYQIRHSAAHILAQAVQRIFGETKFGIGPVTENGFFQDMLVINGTIKEADLAQVELEMKKIVSENLPIVGKNFSRAEALKLMAHDQLKVDLINKFEGDSFGIYTQGEFSTLCEGFHTNFTGDAKFFKLQSIAGVYWQGKKENVQLQRISGVAFETEAELNDYLEKLELAKKYDHRLLGKELDLFSFLPESPGIVFFKPKGLTLFNLLVERCRNLLKKYKYQEIKTPAILREELWHESGHYDNYKENMFFCQSQDERFCIKPMNCPGAILMYRDGLHSYRDLPMRLAEFGLVHRYELSGALHGLFRVRAFTQDDAHVFCTSDSLKEEIRQMLQFCKELYNPFKFPQISFSLSTRPNKSIGNDDNWNKGTAILKEVLEEEQITFSINEGDGAFYGPKIDIRILDGLGREWQCGTIQVDFVLPERFKISYVDSDQSRKTPIIIHRALFGSVERFLGICIEHFKGKFPLWLAPIQARILSISEQHVEYAKIVSEALSNKMRTDADFSNDTISAKIRNANLEKIPLMIVIGGKEAENKTITLRTFDGKQQFNLTVEEFLQSINEELV